MKILCDKINSCVKCTLHPFKVVEGKIVGADHWVHSLVCKSIWNKFLSYLLFTLACLKCHWVDKGCIFAKGVRVDFHASTVKVTSYLSLMKKVTWAWQP